MTVYVRRSCSCWFWSRRSWWRRWQRQLEWFCWWRRRWWWWRKLCFSSRPSSSSSNSSLPFASFAVVVKMHLMLISSKSPSVSRRLLSATVNQTRYFGWDFRTSTTHSHSLGGAATRSCRNLTPWQPTLSAVNEWRRFDCYFVVALEYSNKKINDIALCQAKIKFQSSFKLTMSVWPRKE